MFAHTCFYISPTYFYAVPTHGQHVISHVHHLILKANQKKTSIFELYKQQKHITMTAPFILALSLLTSPLNDNINVQPSEPVESAVAKSLTISWNNSNIDEIELRSEYNIMIPSIMTEGSMQIHLNNLIDGNYFLILKTNGEIKEIREFKVENMILLAINNTEH